MDFKRGECVIRFGGIYMRGRQGQRCVMSLYQEQYIAQLFQQYLNDFHILCYVIYNTSYRDRIIVG